MLELIENGADYITLSQLLIILDSIHDGVYILNSRGQFVLINKSVEKITLYDRSKLYGVKAMDLVQQGLLDHSITERVIKTKKPVTELQTTFGDVSKEIMVTSIPIFDEHNNIAYIVANIRDMTELNKIKMERERARKVIEEYNLEKTKNEYIKNNIIAKSNKMNNVLELSKRAAQFNSTVVLSGETGTGKEVVAKFIHAIGTRKSEPFISVNCAAIPENLLESELFGYEKGAFTNANIEGKIGLFELADEGTLFLDEINSLPLTLQGKILRFIETQEIIRVGGTTSKKIDVRIIATTNRDLREMVSKGEFREDLYFRLNVIPIEIPPLRERKEDILPLCLFFLESFNKENNTNKKISSTVLDIMEDYEWPGNVRELRNIIERLVVMCPNDIITINDLPSDMVEEKYKHMPYTIVVNELVPLKTIVSEAEKVVLKKARTELGTTREMAHILGVSQTTVVRKMNEYNIK